MRLKLWRRVSCLWPLRRLPPLWMQVERVGYRLRAETFRFAFTFKADGAKLTGTMQGMDGMDIKIADGKLDGDKIAFSVTLDFGGMARSLLTYTGVVPAIRSSLSGDAGGMPFEFVVKKRNSSRSHEVRGGRDGPRRHRGRRGFLKGAAAEQPRWCPSLKRAPRSRWRRAGAAGGAAAHDSSSTSRLRFHG